MRALYDVPAPAKLNLWLRLVGKRADGLHLLESPMVLIDWCDTLHFERNDTGRIERRDLAAALPADDLTLRAARALQEASGTTRGVDIAIEKRVPWGAGMGGGSSDAATTLLALDRLWGLGWPLERLAQIGLALGADVPFFLRGGNAMARGIGEILEPMGFEPRWFVVVKPPAALATRAVFAHPKVAERVRAARIAGFSEERNDLQDAAVELCPEIQDALDELAGTFGASRMTGSGSAVFADVGAVSSGPPKADAPSRLAEGWQSRLCRSLAAHPLAGWARRSEGTDLETAATAEVSG